MIRNLKANEIELKPCQIADDKKWVQLLCYKTSRVDMQILTETFGIGWKSEYKMIGDSLFCTISVKDKETGEWISRTDCGERNENINDNNEKKVPFLEKGYATSAFKRAATQFGIGQNLYNSPKIFINLIPDDFTSDGRLKQNRFKINDISYDENNEISALEIKDTKGNIRWTMNAENSTPSVENKGKSNMELLTEFCSKKKTEQNINLNCLKKFYEFYSKKMEEWKGTVQPEKLWSSWEIRERKQS